MVETEKSSGFAAGKRKGSKDQCCLECVNDFLIVEPMKGFGRVVGLGAWVSLWAEKDSGR